MNEVSTTILPHPVSMFIIGALLMSVIMLYREYKTLLQQVKDLKNDNSKLLDKMDKVTFSIDEKISSISKKIDSRVDKALISIKK